MGAAGAILPLLNGMRHLDRLGERLGAERVHGRRLLYQRGARGAAWCVISARCSRWSSASCPARTAPAPRRSRRYSPRTKAQATLSTAILQAMWEKWVMLAALAAATTLARATVGEIMAAPSGEAFLLGALGECAAVAAAEGHAPGASRARPGAHAADAARLGLCRLDAARSRRRPADRGRSHHRRPRRARPRATAGCGADPATWRSPISRCTRRGARPGLRYRRPRSEIGAAAVILPVAMARRLRALGAADLAHGAGAGGAAGRLGGGSWRGGLVVRRHTANMMPRDGSCVGPCHGWRWRRRRLER